MKLSLVKILKFWDIDAFTYSTKVYSFMLSAVDEHLLDNKTEGHCDTE